jgi:type II secretory pathway pseudopilin PulG
MLLAIMAAMGVMLTVVMPYWKKDLQREDEAELVFRGEAIANAIRTYKAKTGGYPLALKDLEKLRPRIIRKLYTDPMTREGDWDLITAVQPGASGDTTGLPIVGVRSKGHQNSYLLYKGKDQVSDWTFSAADNLLGIPGGAALLGLDGKVPAATTAAPATTPTPTPPKPTP